MRKILLFGLFTALILTLAACDDGGRAASTTGTPESAQPSAPSSEKASASSAGESEPPAIDPLPESPSEPSSVSLAEGESMVTGLITYSDGAMLMIVTPDFKNYMFTVAGDDVDTSGARGLVEGSEVDVYFTGELKENDPSGMPATRLIQSEAQSIATSNVKAAVGEIVSCDDTALSINTPGGDNLTFTISDGNIDKSSAGNLASGEYVTVFYTGDIEDSASGGVQVVRLVQ